MNSLFSDLQEAIAARLRGEAWLTEHPAVQISTEREGDVASAIERGLKGAGLAVAILTPRLAATDGPGRMLEVTLLVGVAENPRTNRGPTGTRKPACDVSTTILALLWDWTPDDIWQPLSFVERVIEESTPELVAHSMRFSTRVRVESGQALPAGDYLEGEGGPAGRVRGSAGQRYRDTTGGHLYLYTGESPGTDAWVLLT